jgi:hypothetical protein
LGVNVRGSVGGIEEAQARIESGLARLEQSRQVQLEMRRQDRDQIPSLQEQLERARSTPEYAAVFADREPLVSVRIPAWKKTDELLNVAVASVLAQTYQRLEVIVVNDGPNPATRVALDKLADPRIRYVEFPEQNRYPADTHLRWMVAGSPGMNRGAQLAQGSWIAPLDDDDEFSPNHLEALVTLALKERAELAYGAIIQKNLSRGTESVIWSEPPTISEFTFMGAIYMKALGFFEYDTESWMVEEPGDWNLMRRMQACGVRMASTRDVVGTMYSIAYGSKE